MSTIPASKKMRNEKVPVRFVASRCSSWITPGRGTATTNFRGRARVKRLRLRKLQRQARRRQSL